MVNADYPVEGRRFTSMELKEFLRDNKELRKSYLTKLLKTMLSNYDDVWTLANHFEKMDWSLVDKEQR